MTDAELAEASGGSNTDGGPPTDRGSNTDGGSNTAGSRSNKRVLWFVAAGLLVAFILAGVVSNFASSSPDGLDSTTLQGCTTDEDGAITGGTCMAQQAEEHQFAGGLFADYGIKGIDNPYLATGLSGVIGVAVTFAIGAGFFWLARRRSPAGSGPSDGSGES